MKIVFLHEKNNITTNFSMVPFYLWGLENDKFDIRFCVDYQNIDSFNGDLLVIVRRYELDDLSNEFVSQEIEFFYKCFRKIIYFDDSAALSKINWFIANRVDLYCKRGLLKDRNIYKRSLYGGRLFSDFYHTQFNVIDDVENNSHPDYTNKYDWDKIEIAWNIGVGMYITSQGFLSSKFSDFIKKGSKYYSQFFNSNINKVLAKKNIDKIINKLSLEVENKNNHRIMARITSNGYSNTVGFQRLLIKDKLIRRGIDSSKISFSKYLDEVNKSSVFISPFGWGEICFRDFEALLFGKILIKPNCNHIETWPNIYEDDMYIPINWDLSDIDYAIEKAKELQSLKVLNKARLNYKISLKQVSERVDNILKKVL